MSALMGVLDPPKNDRFWHDSKVRCADFADLRCKGINVRFSEPIPKR